MASTFASDVQERICFVFFQIKDIIPYSRLVSEKTRSQRSFIFIYILYHKTELQPRKTNTIDHFIIRPYSRNITATTHTIHTHTMGWKTVSSLLLSWLVIWSSTIHTTITTTCAFEFTFKEDAEELGLSITDVVTDITDVKSFFIDEVHLANVKGIEWIINEEAMENSNSTTTSSSDSGLLLWSTLVDGVMVASGNVSLGQLLPTAFEAGTFVVTSNGKHTVEVIMTINGASELIVSNTYVAYRAGVSIIPMILVLVMAMTTQLVRNRFLLISCLVSFICLQ